MSNRRYLEGIVSARPMTASCSPEPLRKSHRRSMPSSAKAGGCWRCCAPGAGSGAPLSCCGLAECSRNALSSTLLRHSYRDLSRSPRLSSEDWMPQPRGGQDRGVVLRARGGRTEAQTRQAINTVQATRAQTLGVETTVFQAVAQAYLDVVRDQTLVEVAQNNEAVLRRQLEATRDRFRVGEVTRTDVAQAESSLAQATAQRINAEGQLEVSRANYARQVGHPPGRLMLPRERPALPATREEALSLAMHDNPNVISASFTELAARDNVDVVRGQLLPQISIVGDLNRNYAPSISLQGA